MEREILSCLPEDPLGELVSALGPLDHLEAKGSHRRFLKVGVREWEEIILDILEVKEVLHGLFEIVDGQHLLSWAHEIVQALENGLNGSDGNGVSYSQAFLLVPIISVRVASLFLV